MRGSITIAIALLALLLAACHSAESTEIDLDKVKDSAHRTIPEQAKQRVHFYDTNHKAINADQFNRMLADGAYVSRQYIQDNGSEEIHLVSIAEHSQSLEGLLLPEFELTDIEGNAYTRQDLMGKTTILTFWTTSSLVCKKELEQLNELAKEYDKKRGFLWLAPALEPSANLSRFLRKKSLNLDFTFISAQEDLAQQLGLLTYPTHLVIDEKGHIKCAIVRQSDSKKLIRETIGTSL
jgi:peroxiredoxin